MIISRWQSDCECVWVSNRRRPALSYCLVLLADLIIYQLAVSWIHNSPSSEDIISPFLLKSFSFTFTSTFSPKIQRRLDTQNFLWQREEGWAVSVIYGFHKTQPPVLPSNMPFFSEHTTIAQLLALVSVGRVHPHTHTCVPAFKHTLSNH